MVYNIKTCVPVALYNWNLAYKVHCCAQTDLNFKKKDKSTGGESFAEPSPKILACKAKATTIKAGGKYEA